MQKLFNVMSVAAFTMSAGMVIGTVMLYTRIPSLTKFYMSEIKFEITKLIAEMVPGKIDEVHSLIAVPVGVDLGQRINARSRLVSVKDIEL